jgi:hypothetical protein
MALEAMKLAGLALWLVLGAIGAGLLVTGRRTIFGLPKGIREGWPLRVMGLAYCMVAALLVFQVLKGTFYADGVVAGYVFLGITLLVAYDRRRKSRTRGASGPQP